MEVWRGRTNPAVFHRQHTLMSGAKIPAEHNFFRFQPEEQDYSNDLLDLLHLFIR